jgi:hypothetical protein
VFQEVREAEKAIRAPVLKAVAPALALQRPVAQMALAGEPVVLPGSEASGDDVLGIGIDGVRSAPQCAVVEGAVGG